MKKFIEFILIAFPFVFLIILFLAGDIVLFGYNLGSSNFFILGFVIAIIISSCVSYFLFRKILDKLQIMALLTGFNLLEMAHKDLGVIVVGISLLLFGSVLFVGLILNLNFIKIFVDNKPFEYDGKFYRLTDVGPRIYAMLYVLISYWVACLCATIFFCRQLLIVNLFYIIFMLIIISALFIYLSYHLVTLVIERHLIYPAIEPEPPHNDKS